MCTLPCDRAPGKSPLASIRFQFAVPRGSNLDDQHPKGLETTLNSAAGSRGIAYAILCIWSDVAGKLSGSCPPSLIKASYTARIWPDVRAIVEHRRGTWRQVLRSIVLCRMNSSSFVGHGARGLDGTQHRPHRHPDCYDLGQAVLRDPPEDRVLDEGERR